MNYAQARELEAAWRGPLGQWLKQYLKDQSDATRLDAAVYVPENDKEVRERERNFGKAAALTDLLDQIPTQIKELINQTEKQENQ